MRKEYVLFELNKPLSIAIFSAFSPIMASFRSLIKTLGIVEFSDAPSSAEMSDSSTTEERVADGV